MRTRSILAAGLLLALAAQVAVAESILERRYTSEKLDALWLQTLGADAPDPEWFEVLGPGPAGAEPVRDVPAQPDFGVPFFGVVVGESTAADGTVVPRGFPVIPLPPEEAGVLSRRLAWAEIYLGRYRYYEPVSSDDAVVLATLAARQYSAALEAYLIAGRLYFSAPDLQRKCSRLTRMRDLASGALSGLEAEATLEEWQPLVRIQQATADRLGGDALTELVCSVEPVRGRAETVRLVETRVRDRVLEQVRRAVDDTLQLLEAASTEFQTLVNDMDVPIASAEILELERVLGNAAANMILVKEDQLKAAETLAELQAVDLSSLNQPGQLSEFEQGRERMAEMVGLIDGVMAALADLAEVVDDPAASAELARCAGLRGAYSALDVSLDTGILAQQIGAPYEACLAAARQVVAQFQEPSLEQALMAELARHVRQISETFLQAVTP